MMCVAFVLRMNNVYEEDLILNKRIVKKNLKKILNISPNKELLQ